jgi:hypothetical protein
VDKLCRYLVCTARCEPRSAHSRLLLGALIERRGGARAFRDDRPSCELPTDGIAERQRQCYLSLAGRRDHDPATMTSQRSFPSRHGESPDSSSLGAAQKRRATSGGTGGRRDARAPRCLFPGRVHGRHGWGVVRAPVSGGERNADHIICANAHASHALPPRRASQARARSCWPCGSAPAVSSASVACVMLLMSVTATTSCARCSDGWSKATAVARPSWLRCPR